MRKKLGIFIAVVIIGFAAFLSIKIPALGLDSNEFCSSCHVMQSQYETHGHSAHAALTECGDCHLPHSLAYGAVEKAYAGVKDFAGVVIGTDPYEIHTSTHMKEITQTNCIRCHQDLLKQIGNTHEDGGRYCFDCHRNTPHGTYPNMPATALSDMPDLGSVKVEAAATGDLSEESATDALLNQTAESN